MQGMGQDMIQLLRQAAIKAGIKVLKEMDAGKGYGPPGSKKQPAKKKKNTQTPKRKKKGK